MTTTTREEVPEPLDDLLSGRDKGLLRDGALLRYQYIGLTPAIDKNRRFVLHDDGRLFGAVNTGAPSSKGKRFNVPLPDEPTITISDDRMAEVRVALDESGFFDSPRYVAEEGVRDGAVTIVTATGDSGTHQVWYVNIDNDLTDLLWSLLEDEDAAPYDPEQILADLRRTLEDPS